MHEFSEVEDPVFALLLEKRDVECYERIQRIDHPQHQGRHLSAYEFHPIHLFYKRCPLGFLRNDERVQLTIVGVQRLLLTQCRLVQGEEVVGGVTELLDAFLGTSQFGVCLPAFHYRFVEGRLLGLLHGICQLRLPFSGLGRREPQHPDSRQRHQKTFRSPHSILPKYSLAMRSQLEF